MNPSSWTKPPSEERLARQWAAIAARTRPRPHRARWALAAAAVVACAAFVVVSVRGRDARRTPEGPIVPGKLTFETWSGPSVLTMPEGIRVELQDGARVELERREPGSVAVDLVQGTAGFDVKHDPARALVVRAGDVRIEDVGTRFSVERRGDAVTVKVADGAVRVQRGGAGASFAEVHAGETWAVGAVTTELPQPPAPADAPDASVVEAKAVRSPDEVAFATFKSLAVAHRDHEAYAALGEEGFARAVERASPSDLFLLGDVARLSGHAPDAARAYDALRKRHPTNEHAGLAAFELGRLRLDLLRDPKGAEEAFADAVALSPAAPFREDAEARRVEALDAAGEVDACAKAREAYLARYPGGLYETRVDGRCGGR